MLQRENVVSTATRVCHPISFKQRPRGVEISRHDLAGGIVLKTDQGERGHAEVRRRPGASTSAVFRIDCRWSVLRNGNPLSIYRRTPLSAGSRTPFAVQCFCDAL